MDNVLQEIGLYDLEIDFTLEGTLDVSLARLRERLDEGFADVFAEWGEHVALPWLAQEWPRENWTPLRPDTIRRKAKRGKRTPLIDSGALFDAATDKDDPANIFEVSPDSIRLGVDTGSIPYALWQYAGTPVIPARPWDDLSGFPMQELVRMLSESLFADLGSPS